MCRKVKKTQENQKSKSQNHEMKVLMAEELER